MAGSEGREVWGDDPDEVDASAVVAELNAVEPADRRWHDHPGFFPLKAVGRFIRRSGKRIAVTVAGFVVLLLGLAGLAIPILPGWALIFVGLGILATEYMWARRLLMKAKDIAQAAADKTIRRKSSQEKSEAEPGTSLDTD
jgi:hypothetical protein